MRDSHKKIIIFDLDGVILDSIELAEKYFSQRFPTAPASKYREMLCGNFLEEIEKLQTLYPSKIETTSEKQAREDAWIETKSHCKIYEGVRDVVQMLHSYGYTLVINTSAFARNFLPALQRNKIFDLFDWIVSADVAKSKVEKFRMIEEKYDVGKDSMLFVTDTLGDVREACIAGISTVVVMWGAHDESYFKQDQLYNLKKMVYTPEEMKLTICQLLPLDNML